MENDNLNAYVYLLSNKCQYSSEMHSVIDNAISKS